VKQAFSAAIFTLIAALPAAAAAPVNVGGTTNLAPLVAKAAAQYQSANAGSRVQVKGSSSGAGIAALKAHQIDVAMSDVAVSDPDFDDAVIGVVGFAFIAGPNAGVTNLTRAQVQAIYSGKVTNWKQLGGNDQKIVLIGRDIGTGTRFVFEQKVAKTLVPMQITPTADADFKATAQTPGALSYVASYFVGNHQNMVVTYDGVAPTPDNIRNHAYSFSTDEHLYTLKNAGPDVSAFVQYVKNNRALLDAYGVY
jgi:phosphate transport system substrate-binding protein